MPVAVVIFMKFILARQRFIKNSYSEFHEIPTNGLVAVIRRTVGEIDVVST